MISLYYKLEIQVNTVNKNKNQMSESYRIAISLAFSGGFMNAYTYLMRGGVFANAETGNVIFMGLHLMNKDYHRAMEFFIPICSFSFGILCAAFIRSKFQEAKFHWRQYVLVIEMILLIGIGLIPQGDLDIWVNVTVAFVSALQFETFKKVRGDAFSSVFCTGNLRSSMESFFAYLRHKNKHDLYRAFRYFNVILAFAAGVIVCAFFVPYLGTLTIWLADILLIAAFILMFRKEG